MHNYVIYGIIITLVYLCDKSSILSMNLCNGSNIFTLAVTMIHLPHGEIKDEQRTLVTSVHVHITDIIRLQNSPYFCVFKYTQAVKQKAMLYRFLYWFWEKKPTVLQSNIYRHHQELLRWKYTYVYCTFILFMHEFIFIYFFNTNREI